MQVAPADLPDDEHVRVVPIARLRVWRGFVLLEADAAQAAPSIQDVAGRPPAVAIYRPAPFPNVRHAILAKAENDVALLGDHEIAHEFVRVNRAGIVWRGLTPKLHQHHVGHFLERDVTIAA